MAFARTYSEISPPLLVAKEKDAAGETRASLEETRATYIRGLAILIHSLAAAAFTVAAAFTSRFLMMTTFWHGAVLGALTYGLFIFVGGFCGNV